MSRKRYKIGPRLLWIANGLVCDLSIGAISSKLFCSPASSAILCGNTNPRAAMHQREYNAHTVNFIKTAVKLHIIFINLCRQCSTKKVFYMCIFGSDFYVSYFCIVLVVSLRVVCSCLLQYVVHHNVHIKQSHETF